MGRPVNVENVDDLFGLRQMRERSDVESNGLLLFAAAVVIGAGALVGQALVRAVETVYAADDEVFSETLGRMSARAGKGHGRATVGGELACEADQIGRAHV